jgi:hypothetical protein
MADEQHPDWIATELRRAAVTERAPSHLRLQIDEMSRAHSQPTRRRSSRRLLLIPAAGVIAAIVLALLLVLPGGTPGGPTVAQAAAIGAEPVSWSPPAQGISGTSVTEEYARFADIKFPTRLENGAWTFQTWRISELDGRRILTIYYSHGAQAISYSIAATPRLRGQKDGFTGFKLNGRTVVSWQETNHSCLLSSATVSRATLLALARS